MLSPSAESEADAAAEAQLGERREAANFGRSVSSDADSGRGGTDKRDRDKIRSDLLSYLDKREIRWRPCDW